MRLSVGPPWEDSTSSAQPIACSCLPACSPSDLCHRLWHSPPELGGWQLEREAQAGSPHMYSCLEQRK